MTSVSVAVSLSGTSAAPSSLSALSRSRKTLSRMGCLPRKCHEKDKPATCRNWVVGAADSSPKVAMDIFSAAFSVAPETCISTSSFKKGSVCTRSLCVSAPAARLARIPPQLTSPTSVPARKR